MVRGPAPSVGAVYRFLLKPRWILSHIFVLLVVVVMVNMGMWQLRRLDEKKAVNAQITASMHDEAVPIGEVLPDGPASSTQQIDAAVYRPVVVSGRFLADQQVLVNNRTYNSQPGFWVVTPLLLSDGTAIAINRGWIPFSYTPDGDWSDFAPPTGTVTVRGLIRASQVRETDGLVSSPKDASTGVLRTLARLDVGRLAQQVDERIWPMYLELDAQDPPVGELPIPVPLPELSEGPHLGYAIQWFAFSLLTVIVYPLLCIRVARRRSMDGADAEIVDLTQPEVS